MPHSEKAVVQCCRQYNADVAEAPGLKLASASRVISTDLISCLMQQQVLYAPLIPVSSEYMNKMAKKGRIEHRVLLTVCRGRVVGIRPLIVDTSRYIQHAQKIVGPRC
jgi:hypothetical protein